LAHQITQQGALVGDYPLGTQSEAANFPPRNRIISGLAMGVLVTEAGIKSGALITTNFALEQGRAVFAVPGNITATGSDGTNKLIQEGAHVVRKARDVLEVLNLESVIDYVEARETLPADATEARLLAELREGALHVDELGRRCELPIAQVTSTLTLMELKGMVRQVDAMTYARA
jgi:DNA processing protein